MQDQVGFTVRRRTFTQFTPIKAYAVLEPKSEGAIALCFDQAKAEHVAHLLNDDAKVPEWLLSLLQGEQ